MQVPCERPIPGQVADSQEQNASLRELAAFFLRLGTVAFGGPAGHIAMMEDELVRRRKWLTREKFLDLLGASNLIPGPSSSELAIHIGYLRGGLAGLVAAGLCFLLPAAFMVGLLACVYLRFGKLPATEAVLYGVKPVVIAVVLQALWRLGRTAVKTRLLAVTGLACLALAFLNLPPILLLALAGLAIVVVRHMQTARQGEKPISLAFFSRLRLSGLKAFFTGNSAMAGATGTAAAVAAPFSLGSLFLVFLKLGAVVFGSGYVLLAFLRTDLVVHRHWLTDPQLVDAIAVGQVTPGPVFTTATFIGYLLGRTRGAIVATIGIFLPAFLLVGASGPLIPRIRQSKLAGAFLDGVIVASLGLMAEVTWQLARASLVDAATVLIGAASALALLRFRTNSAWLVLAGALVGLVLRRFPGF
jgi:chromate transporter